MSTLVQRQPAPQWVRPSTYHTPSQDGAPLTFREFQPTVRWGPSPSVSMPRLFVAGDQNGAPLVGLVNFRAVPRASVPGPPPARLFIAPAQAGDPLTGVLNLRTATYIPTPPAAGPQLFLSPSQAAGPLSGLTNLRVTPPWNQPRSIGPQLYQYVPPPVDTSIVLPVQSVAYRAVPFVAPSFLVIPPTANFALISVPVVGNPFGADAIAGSAPSTSVEIDFEGQIQKQMIKFGISFRQGKTQTEVSVNIDDPDTAQQLAKQVLKAPTPAKAKPVKETTTYRGMKKGKLVQSVKTTLATKKAPRGKKG